MTHGAVLLITPNWRWDETPLSTDTLRPPPSPPIEMAYIAASLGDVGYVDAYAHNLTIAQMERHVADFRPDAVVVSTAPSILYWRCPPMTVTAATATVAACQAVCSAPIILIGPHGTASPDWTLRTTSADGCFRGAPERRLGPALQTDPFRSPHVHSIRAAATVCIEPASRIPEARWDVIDLRDAYPPHMWCVTAADREVAADLHQGALSEASRGCPWACVYCAKAPVRDQFTRRDVEIVRREWAALRERGVDYVFFIDETFNLGSQRLDKLLEALTESGLRFGFQGRPELIDDDQASALAAAGCVYAELGIDINGSESSHQAGRRQDRDAAWRGVERCAQHVPVVRYNRLNLSTLDYRVRLGLDQGDSWAVPPDPAYPYPGAPLGEMVMQLYGREEFDWDFALRYSWWLRLEVAAQRAGRAPSDSELAATQAQFLALDDEAAWTIAAACDGLQIDPDFAAANKLVRGLL